jgi:multiple sugar transport system ATP-binding protein
MATVEIEGVSKTFGDVRVLSGIDLDIASGEFVVLVGPSGCGKSTLLRLIAGLEPMQSGTISIDGRVMNEVPPAKRDVAMVFQSYALYPHKTVAENMAFALKIARVPRAEIDRQVAAVAELLHLKVLLDRKPRELSGGQRQRVAIGRALVRHPKVFLFDEPLSNLDAALRTEMRVEIARLHQNLRSTVIYVTHDQVEAMTMAQRIAVMNNGRIEQIGSPLNLYHRPRTRFVAGFIGSPRMNFLPGILEHIDRRQIRVRLGCGVVLGVDGLTPPAKAKPGDAVTVAARPEQIEGGEGQSALAARVELIESLGSETIIHGRLDDGTQIVQKVLGSVSLNPGDLAHMNLLPGSTHLFDESGDAFASADG